MGTTTTTNILTNSQVSALNNSAGATKGANTGTAKKVGKEEFLTMLVAQLKAQDPMDPMKNEDFAVNLAQFSQLEQLMDINNKLGTQASDVNSMASYLGHEVVLNSDTVSVKNGSGGDIAFELPAAAQSVKAQLVAADGSVADEIDLGAMNAGQQMGSLDDLKLRNGDYQVRVSAVRQDGLEFSPQVFAAGVVNGFVPGADPVLLLGGREVSPGDIKEVRAVSQQG